MVAKMIKDCGVALFNWLLSLLPRRKNKVLMISFGGMGYGGNPKYVAEVLIRDYRHTQVYWGCSKGRLFHMDGLKTFEINRFRLTYHLSTAESIVVDTTYELPFRKKKNQRLFQLWHGALALKKIEFDAADTLDDRYLKHASKTIGTTDYFVSSSALQDAEIRRAFRYRGALLRTGLPRMSGLFDEKASMVRSEVRTKYGAKENTFVVLYAPTLRDDGDLSGLLHDYGTLIKAISEKHPKAQLWVRLHPSNLRLSENVDYGEAINVAQHVDSDELCLAADMVITDYSSVFIDFALLNKPVLLYARDIDHYEKLRGLYSFYRSLPYSICYSFDQLLANLKTMGDSEYRAQNTSFLNYLKPYDPKDAASAVAYLIAQGHHKESHA